MEQSFNAINQFIILLSTDNFQTRSELSYASVCKGHLASKHAMTNELLKLNRASLYKLPPEQSNDYLKVIKQIEA